MGYDEPVHRIILNWSTVLYITNGTFRNALFEFFFSTVLENLLGCFTSWMPSYRIQLSSKSWTYPVLNKPICTLPPRNNSGWDRLVNVLYVTTKNKHTTLSGQHLLNDLTFTKTHLWLLNHIATLCNYI